MINSTINPQGAQIERNHLFCADTCGFVHPRSAAGSCNNNHRSWHWREHFIHCSPYLFFLYVLYSPPMQGVVSGHTQKESKISTSSLHSAPSVLIVVDPVDVAVTVFSDVCHPRPYTTNKKDACKHHASKCADHLRTRNMNELALLKLKE